MTTNIATEELVKLINNVEAWNGGKASIYVQPHIVLKIDDRMFLSDELIGGKFLGLSVKSVSEFVPTAGNYSVSYENVILE